jgi:BMFP domain-containing protein YqiC
MRSRRDNLAFLDDLAKVAAGALGSLGEARHHVRAAVRERVDQLVAQMDLVSREDFERVEALAERARNRQEELEERLKRLEKRTANARHKTEGKRKRK